MIAGGIAGEFAREDLAAMDSVPRWELEADYIETCNCDFGCPCNFDGFPTDGRCEALVAYHIRSGNFGGVLLDGLDFILAYSWPGAIHEGNGTVQIYVTDRATPEQRVALTEIAYGRAGGNGAFAIFADTFSRVLEPEFVPVEMRLEGKRSGFAVRGILEARVTPHVDPVSGKEADVQMVLPQGFIWKRAHAVKSAAMRIASQALTFGYPGKNAFVSLVKYEGP